MEMSRLRVLQLACYQGNVGDNANIAGVRTLLSQHLETDIDYTDLDILDFVWGKRQYDQEFVQQVNQHDLLIVGGGGFFELTIDHTRTGTPLDLDADVLGRIKTPIVFYALGLNAYRDVPAGRLAKFRAFLDILLASENILVSIRNDGSMDAVRRLLGPGYADRMYATPDGGFFTEVDDWEHPELPAGKTVIGINLAGDMLDLRFPDSGTTHSRVAGAKRRVVRAARALLGRRVDAPGRIDDFFPAFSALLRRYLEERDDLHLVLVPHIYKDLKVIDAFLASLARSATSWCRRRVTVAPYATGGRGQSYIFDLYRKCDLVMGMRFHANVCGIGLGVPTIGLETYPQIGALYRGLGLAERAVEVNTSGFEDELASLIDASLADPDSVRSRYGEIRATLLGQAKAFHEVIRERLLQPRG
jgi:polysaccharide pyruvyl transferase WcaK-like protein